MGATTELALRLGRADADLWRSWLRAVANLPGDPYGADVRCFGDAVALLVHGVPLAYYNRVLMIGSGDGGLVSEVANFYRSRMTPCRVDVIPYAADATLLESLDYEGFRPAALQSNLFGPAAFVEESPPDSLRVTDVLPGEINFFAHFYDRAYYDGRRIAAGVKEFRAATIRARYGRAGWRFYLCCVDGVPAAGAVLFVNDGVATLAGAATTPNFRGRGCQRALLRARLNDAAEEGCDLVVSRCGVGSASQHNMERAGLRTGYTKVIWEQRGIADAKWPADGSGRRGPRAVPEAPARSDEEKLLPAAVG